MNKYKENVYKNIFEYPTKKIVELEFKNEVLEKENQLLKKQKHDVVEYIKKCHISELEDNVINLNAKEVRNLLRMLGEIDD